MDEMLENLFDCSERESIDDWFHEAFKDLAECRKGLDKLHAGKASTPDSETVSMGLAP